MKAILVDDEDKSNAYMQTLLQKHCPEIEVIATCNNFEDAYKKITTYQPDIVFLDIEMPPYLGFDLLKLFTTFPFEVIFVTAFHQYAIEAIKFSALYYILKPVDPVELMNAVQKAKQKQNDNSIRYNFLKNIVDEPSIKKLIIKGVSGISVIELANIQYLHADGAYTHFVMNNGEQIITSKNLMEYEEMLIPKGFFRNHKSYIVNLKFVKSIVGREANEILMNTGEKIPLAVRRKDAFLKVLAV